jgi:hypothetical protein
MENIEMNPVADMKTNPNSVPESDLAARTQCTQDNLRMIHSYFDALFTKDMNPDARHVRS